MKVDGLSSDMERLIGDKHAYPKIAEHMAGQADKIHADFVRDGLRVPEPRDFNTIKKKLGWFLYRVQRVRQETKYDEATEHLFIILDKLIKSPYYWQLA